MGPGTPVETNEDWIWSLRLTATIYPTCWISLPRLRGCKVFRSLASWTWGKGITRFPWRRMTFPRLPPHLVSMSFWGWLNYIPEGHGPHHRGPHLCVLLPGWYDSGQCGWVPAPSSPWAVPERMRQHGLVLNWWEMSLWPVVPGVPWPLGVC
jgi:hypothetical protein